APGAAARLGLGYDVLAAKKPSIIVCDISGYGADGPYRDKKAYDLLIQSEAGFVSVTGTPDEPCKAGTSIADIAAGMYAYTNILAALRGLIVETFASLTAPQVVERLEAAQIANARVNTMHEVWEHPQLKARERWREVGSPVGALPAMLPPGTWNEGPRMDPVPALGEHTDSILAELGIDADGIRSLRAAEAI